MAKYSFEFKKKLVKAYINDDGSYHYLSNKYGISDSKQLRKWVSAYNFPGDDGLLCSRKNKNYTFEYKLSVV